MSLICTTTVCRFVRRAECTLYSLLLFCFCVSIQPAFAQEQKPEEPAETQEEVSAPLRSNEEITWSDDEGIIVVVGSPYIELYKFHHRGYPRFHAIEKNEHIRIFKTHVGWYKVETEDGKVGWTPRRDLHTLFDLAGNPLDFSIHSWDENRDQWQLGLLGGVTDGALSYTVYTGYGFTPNISAEIKYTQTFAESSTIKQAHLMLVHKLFPRWRVTPFFTLGAGLVKTLPHTTIERSVDREDTALTVGAGVTGYISHNVLLRIDYNSHTILTTQAQNKEIEEWKVGFSVLF